MPTLEKIARIKGYRLIAELPRYKGISARWQRWDDVVAECRLLAWHMI